MTQRDIETVFLTDLEESVSLGDWDEDDKDYKDIEKVEDESPSEAEKAGQF